MVPFSGAAKLAAVAITVLMAARTAANAVPTDAPTATVTPITIEEIASGLENPWGVAPMPSGGYLVTERPGRLRIVKDGQISGPVAGVPAVLAERQGGLLDVALDPDFATNATIYLSYSEPRENGMSATAVASAKLAITQNSGTLENLKVIFQQQPPIASGVHFGSRLVFDKTGALFITTGDRGSQSQSAQNTSTLIGKVIRINRDGSIPNDNPFVGKDGARPEVWSYGHRNLQGAALDSTTGQLWTTEHGAMGGDELNTPQPGKNYGWPLITWGIDYSGMKIGDGSTAKPGLEQPIYYWVPSIATSGLAIYNGGLFKDWQGNILVGGLKGNVLQRLVMKDGQVVAVETLLTDLEERIRDVRIDRDGAVLVLTDDNNGRLLRLTPKPPGQAAR